MTAEPVLVDLDMERLLQIDRRIDQHEGEGLRGRWEFGRLMLADRGERPQQRRGYLDALAAATGKNREELKRRARFAEIYDSEEELGHAVTQFGSWHQVVKKGLKGMKPKSSGGGSYGGGYDAGSVLIYFHGDEDEKYVKLGKTARPSDMRFREHQRQGPYDRPMHFLAGVLGSPVNETTLIEYFREYRARGKEWLHAVPEVTDYIRWLLNEWYVAGYLEECDDLLRQDSDRWLPNPDRVIEAPAWLPLRPWITLERPKITGDDYYTNEVIIDAARDVMGAIDLDPASHPIANREVRAAKYFTTGDNGLLREWGGRVWVNPPFGQWEDWADKIVREWRSGEISEMCVLAATRSITARCFSPLLANCSGQVVLHGRIPFWGPKATGTPDDGHVVLYFGKSLDRFADRFSALGNVFGLQKPCAQLLTTTPAAKPASVIQLHAEVSA